MEIMWVAEKSKMLNEAIQAVFSSMAAFSYVGVIVMDSIKLSKVHFSMAGTSRI